MSGAESEFFLDGAALYLDVRDVLEEFERQVLKRCKKTATNRMAEIETACGSGFWAETGLTSASLKWFNITDPRLKSRHWMGVTLNDGEGTLLRFCLELIREPTVDEPTKYGARVILRTKNTARATALWQLWPNRDHNRLFFGRASEAQLSDFDRLLDEAISEFITFIEQAGGLRKYCR